MEKFPFDLIKYIKRNNELFEKMQSKVTRSCCLSQRPKIANNKIWMKKSCARSNDINRWNPMIWKKHAHSHPLSLFSFVWLSGQKKLWFSILFIHTVQKLCHSYSSWSVRKFKMNKKSHSPINMVKTQFNIWSVYPTRKALKL